MASYQGHLAFSTTLGAVYGGVACWKWQLDWAPVFLGTGLTALGGMLPDLDSDSGVPVRELSGLAAAIAPFLLLGRLESAGLSMDQILVVLGASYLVIRYAVAALFKVATVHRGMFHSLPAMAIAGLLVFLLYHHPNLGIRLFLAAGTMLGFFSHLVLDELCSVDFLGAHRTRAAGNPLKLYSSSWTATLTAYALLGGLVWLANSELEGGLDLRRLGERIGNVFSPPSPEGTDLPVD
jgi:hypothetical protein